MIDVISTLYLILRISFSSLLMITLFVFTHYNLAKSVYEGLKYLQSITKKTIINSKIHLICISDIIIFQYSG